jgi:hypothetical protein
MSQKQIYLGIGAVVLLAALIAGYSLFGATSVSPTPAKRLSTIPPMRLCGCSKPSGRGCWPAAR